MADDDDKQLVARTKSPANDRLSRALNLLGFLAALGMLIWAVIYALG